MANFSFKTLKKNSLNLDKKNKDYWQNLLKIDQPLLDSDGYPTEHACEIIKYWHHSDYFGWFDFIKNIWQHKSLTWITTTEQDKFNNKTITYLHVSTFGWSGNESLISSMQENHILWHETWYQSNRGGHYIFDITFDNF